MKCRLSIEYEVHVSYMFDKMVLVEAIYAQSRKINLFGLRLLSHNNLPRVISLKSTLPVELSCGSLWSDRRAATCCEARGLCASPGLKHALGFWTERLWCNLILLASHHIIEDFYVQPQCSRVDFSDCGLIMLWNNRSLLNFADWWTPIWRVIARTYREDTLLW